MISPHGPVDANELSDAAKTGVMQVRIADISAAEDLYLMMPKCTVTKISSVLSGAISVADATITAYNNTDAMTDGVITLAYDGSAAGDIDSCTPTDNLTFDGSTDYLKLVGDGGSTTAVPVHVLVEYTKLD